MNFFLEVHENSRQSKPDAVNRVMARVMRMLFYKAAKIGDLPFPSVGLSNSICAAVRFLGIYRKMAALTQFMRCVYCELQYYKALKRKNECQLKWGLQGWPGYTPAHTPAPIQRHCFGLTPHKVVYNRVFA